jgi:hypothetical protein
MAGGFPRKDTVFAATGPAIGVATPWLGGVRKAPKWLFFVINNFF